MKDIKDKTKLRLKTRSKILVLGLIFTIIILVGLFSPAVNVQAGSETGQYCGPNSIPENGCTGICGRYIDGFSQGAGTAGPASNCLNIPDKNVKAIFFKTSEEQRKYDESLKAQGVTNNTVTVTDKQIDTAAVAAKEKEKVNILYSKLQNCINLYNGTMEGCIVKIAYWVFYALPSNILYYSAFLFNALLALTLSTALYAGNFLPGAWRIVRDFSNIFFILILLYIAIKMILGLGGAEIKKMIVQVVIVALLINFSMFFTQVVIDSSNILALIFYNKITLHITKDKVERKYDPVFTESKVMVEEKDFAGGIMEAFDPTRLMTEDIFNESPEARYLAQFKTDHPFLEFITFEGAPLRVLLGYENPGNTAFLLGIIAVSCAIFLFAAYAFFIAALAFIGRLIELWMLIIFSPFAFMSLSIPELKKLDWLGFDAWLKRLVTVAFMAPIFMFFMLLISKLVQIDIFGSLADPKQRSAGKIMLIVIPGIIYVTLLWKATSFAKKGSGEFGAAVIKYGQVAAGVVGGLALTAASGGATAGIGSLSSMALSSKGLNKASKGDGLGGMAARLALKTADYGTRASFDPRALKIGGKSLGSMTGTGEAKYVGGYEKRRKDKEEKRQKRAKDLEVREDEESKQELNAVENDLQELLKTNSHNIAQIDKRIKMATENANALTAASKADSGDLVKKAAAKEATEIVTDMRKERKALKDGATGHTRSAARIAAGEATAVTFTDNRTAATAAHPHGLSINNLEDDIIPAAKHKIEIENRDRKQRYAERLQKKWFWGRTNRAAAHKIRMEAKLDSGKMNNPPLTI